MDAESPLDDLKISPNIETMAEEQKERVKDLRIENQYGALFFPGFTDIRGVDIGEVVQINPNVKSV